MAFTKRLLSKIKRSSIDALFFLNLEKTIISGKKTNQILMYHGIDLVEEKKFNSRCIGVKNFEKQLLFLKKHTNIISLQDFFDEKFDPSKSNIAITFDDGFLNNYLYAVPLLNKLKINATIYVTGLNNTEYEILWPDYLDLTSYFTSKEINIDNVVYTKNSQNKYYSPELDLTLNEVVKQKGNFEFKQKVFAAFDDTFLKIKEDNQYSDYWKLMSDQQLQEVDKTEYVRIESHAYWHNNLGNISIEQAKKELIDSKLYLENILQREITELAYPDGSYTRDLISAAESIGYKYQLAADGYRFEEDLNDPRILDRVGIYPYDTWSNQMYDLIIKE